MTLYRCCAHCAPRCPVRDSHIAPCSLCDDGRLNADTPYPYTPPRSGVRCPNPEPHEPHNYTIRAEGVTFAGGLCDPAQWPA